MTGDYIILEIDKEYEPILEKALAERGVNHDLEDKTDVGENGIREYVVLTAYPMNFQHAFYLGISFAVKMLSEDFNKKNEVIAKMMATK